MYTTLIYYFLQYEKNIFPYFLKLEVLLIFNLNLMIIILLFHALLSLPDNHSAKKVISYTTIWIIKYIFTEHFFKTETAT